MLKKWFLLTFYLVLMKLKGQNIELQEGKSMNLCNIELRITEVWIHQHKPYVSFVFENQNDTFSLTYGERLPFLTCDLYVLDIQKIGNLPAKIELSAQLKEQKSLNVINKMVLKPQKLYDINGLLVSFVKKGNYFEFEINEKERLVLGLKNILWLGQNAFALTKYQKEELHLVRVSELLYYKGDTLFQLSNEELPYSQAFIEQIVMLPKPGVQKKLEDYTEEDYQICLVKIYLEPVGFQTKKDRFIVNNQERELPYSIIKVFRDKKEAFEYAFQNKIKDIFID